MKAVYAGTMAHDHHSHDHDHHDHDHNHGHGHDDHGHSHVHAPTSFGWRFLVAAALNAAFIVAEVVYGLSAKSLALLADAGHNFGDVIGLLMAWGAWWLAQRAPRPGFTYGFRGASIMAATANGLLLLIAVGGIAFEAVERLMSVQAAVAGGTVTVVAAIGIVVNGVTAWLFMDGKSDLNVRAAFLHLAGDAAVSAAVVAAGLVIMATHWTWLDPVMSLVVCAVILWGTKGLLVDSFRLSLQGVPAGIDFARVRGELSALPGVSGVHDLHIWGMSTTEVALTAHLVMPGGHPGDSFLHEVCEAMQAHHGIGHVTLQIEIGDGALCALTPDGVI